MWEWVCLCVCLYNFPNAVSGILHTMSLQINMHVYFGFAFFFIWPKARPFASFPSTVRLKIVDSCQRTWTSVCMYVVWVESGWADCDWNGIESVVLSCALCYIIVCTVAVCHILCVHFKRIWYVERFSIISRANDVELNWLVYASSGLRFLVLRLSQYSDYERIKRMSDNFVFARIFRLHCIRDF